MSLILYSAVDSAFVNYILVEQKTFEVEQFKKKKSNNKIYL